MRAGLEHAALGRSTINRGHERRNKEVNNIFTNRQGQKLFGCRQVKKTLMVKRLEKVERKVQVLDSRLTFEAVELYTPV